jgi:2-hydroxycyclohexanecarboxyl-CoA dehydrogenase
VTAIIAAGGQGVGVTCDVTDYTGVVKAVAEFESKTGAGTDILVNNAGWDTPTQFLKTEEAFWKKIVSINYFGPLHLSHAVGQGMAARKAGRIINIASDAGRVGSRRDHRLRQGAGA